MEECIDRRLIKLLIKVWEVHEDEQTGKDKKGQGPKDMDWELNLEDNPNPGAHSFNDLDSSDLEDFPYPEKAADLLARSVEALLSIISFLFFLVFRS